jgi:hypothetical protein
MESESSTLFDTLSSHFQFISRHLSRLELTVPSRSLHRIERIQFPLLKNIRIRTIGIGPSQALCQINAPKVEEVILQISDSSRMSFAPSTSTSQIKRLAFMMPYHQTPLSQIFQYSQERTIGKSNSTMLVDMPFLEEAVIAVHDVGTIETPTRQVKWPLVRKVTLVLQAGIADFLTQIDLPSLEEVQIVFPQWWNEQLQRRTRG